jgi:hypothetical protein
MRMTVHSFGFVGVIKGFNGTPGQKLSAVPCGSEPARESGVPVDVDVDVD